MKDFVVYSVLVGDYDQIEQPMVVDDRFDYVLFTDNVTSPTIGVWQLRTFPYSNSDLTRVSRYPKMHPESLLYGYKASLYHDANIQITDTRIYECVISAYSSGIDWAGVKHPLRDCIYDEAYQVYGLDKEDVIFSWCHYLRQERYPRHNGLFENAIIFRIHNDSVRRIDEMWWQVVETYSRRDQLSLQYILWRNPIARIGLLLNENEDIRSSDTVRICNHNQKVVRHRSIDESFWEHSRTRCRRGMEEKVERFRSFHYWLYGLNPYVAKLLLYSWGLYALCVYGITIKHRANKKKRYA